ncbi:Ent-kaurenoic acid oxidase 2 [Ananas comosus]|uniref:Ent-kaurenoic acid oxidase 2 n=1 Tax=Ananas comosus TaxID=4615 RepID=A0A199UMX0_ANACO|nr:Ent-kaurenoic acid oxidase 2 [Ananas comosus]
MDTATLCWYSGLLFGLLPLLLQIIWHWNDLLFLAKLKLRYGLSENSNNGGHRLPPGQMGLPFLGETLRFLWYFKIARRPDDFINSKKQKYGEGIGMYRSHLFGKPTIISCTPASNKFVLQSPDFPLKWITPELLGVKSMFNVEGTQHARIRSFVVDAVNRPDSLRRIANVLHPIVAAALCSWSEKGTIAAYSEIKKMTFKNTCKMFVSIEPGPLFEALDKYFNGTTPGIRAYPLNFPGTALHYALKCRRKLTAVFSREVERRRKGRSEGNHESKDLMDGLMDIEDEEGKHLSDDEVVDNIVSLVIGGYQSVTLTSTWALYLLSKSPQVLQKLREENMAVGKRANGDPITFEDISKLKYTAMVVEESIRKANIVSLLCRVAKKDVEYKGFRIPKGWQVLVWIRSLHTDPKYFDDPMSFVPERWDVPVKPIGYQGFGVGPRICAGNMLARLQITVILHHAVLGYKWKLVNPDAKIKYLPHPLPCDGAVMDFAAL